MRIIQTIPTLAAGGAESLVADLSAAHAMMGHEVTVFLLCGIRDERGRFLENFLADAGVRIVNANRGARDVRNVLDLWRLIRQIEPHTIHAHLHAAEFVTALASAMFSSRLNTFRTLHSTEYALGTDFLTSYINDQLFRVTVACSHAVADAYLETSRPGREKHVTIVPNGVRFPAKTIPPKSSLSHQSPFRFIMIGAFRGPSLEEAQKAHDIALRALADTHKHGADITVTFVGDGPLRSSAENLANLLQIQDRVTFTGVVPSTDELLRSHDALLMPSRWEGLPITLLEATGMGLPAVVSKIDSIVHADHDFPWIYAGMNDVQATSQAMQRMLFERKVFRSRAQTAAERVRALYSISRTALDYIQIYESPPRGRS